MAPGDGEAYTYGHSPVVVGVHEARTAEREAAFFLPRLRPGMRVLDAGCGPGTITVGLARAVAPAEVVGIDAEPGVLARARELAAAQAVGNVTFRPADVYALPFPDGDFDAVFAHTLLEHLQRPDAALRELCRVLRPGGGPGAGPQAGGPGGVLGVRDCDWGSAVFWPADDAVARGAALYARVWAHNGGQPDCGRRLPALLREAGLTGVETSTSFRWDGSLESSRSFGTLLAERLRLPNLRRPIEAQGWLEGSTVEEVAAGCAAWSRHPDAFAAVVMVEACGIAPA
ncbi:MAG TPA: methyltransferase domain-containing protein [Chloroflexota bacterium]|nr:methyltransferase domain-containing protein [Chloroflexota bacterium]